MLTTIVTFNYNCDQLGTPAFRENYLYLLVQCRVKLDRSLCCTMSKVELKSTTYITVVYF
jgi:hypothetical protein